MFFTTLRRVWCEHVCLAFACVCRIVRAWITRFWNKRRSSCHRTSGPCSRTRSRAAWTLRRCARRRKLARVRLKIGIKLSLADRSKRWMGRKFSNNFGNDEASDLSIPVSGAEGFGRSDGVLRRCFDLLQCEHDLARRDAEIAGDVAEGANGGAIITLDMSHATTRSWKRFPKGFMCGSLFGCSLVAFGWIGWGIAFLIGLEKDTSMRGVSLIPLYVLSFGLGGAAVAMVRNDTPTRARSLVAWSVAVVVVLVGCGLMAFLLASEKPIESYWGFFSSVILLVLLVASALARKVGSPDHA